MAGGPGYDMEIDTGDGSGLRSRIGGFGAVGPLGVAQQLLRQVQQQVEGVGAPGDGNAAGNRKTRCLLLLEELPGGIIVIVQGTDLFSRQAFEFAADV